MRGYSGEGTDDKMRGYSGEGRDDNMRGYSGEGWDDKERGDIDSWDDKLRGYSGEGWEDKERGNDKVRCLKRGERGERPIRMAAELAEAFRDGRLIVEDLNAGMQEYVQWSMRMHKGAWKPNVTG